MKKITIFLSCFLFLCSGCSKALNDEPLQQNSNFMDIDSISSSRKADSIWIDIRVDEVRTHKTIFAIGGKVPEQRIYLPNEQFDSLSVSLTAWNSSEPYAFKNAQIQFGDLIPTLKWKFVATIRIPGITWLYPNSNTRLLQCCQTTSHGIKVTAYLWDFNQDSTWDFRDTTLGRSPASDWKPTPNIHNQTVYFGIEHENGIISRRSVKYNTYSSFTDSRDSEVYIFISIDSLEWMAENVRYKTQSSAGKIWCSGDPNDSCKPYGFLYSWSAANNACPEGWRIPTRSEWSGLTKVVGGAYHAGNSLKSRTGWENGWEHGRYNTDKIGFSALPSGIVSSNEVIKVGHRAGFWARMAPGSVNPWAYKIEDSTVAPNQLDLTGDHLLYEGRSVRCVRKVAGKNEIQ